MHTDRAMDNLVRAYNEQPFVQVAYRALVLTDTQTVKANLGNQIGPSSSKSVVQGAANILAVAHAYTDHRLSGGGGSRDRQMTFKSDPVTGKLDIYDLYAAYAHDPALFTCSDEDPGCAAHVKRQCGGRWYWVPAHAGNEFLQLVQRTSFGPPPSAPAEVFWETGVVSAEAHFDAARQPVKNKLELTLLRPVPNDDGLLRVTLRDGRKRWLTANALPKDATGRLLAPGAPTLRLLVQFDPKALTPEEQAQLPGAAASFLSQYYPNPTPPRGGRRQPARHRPAGQHPHPAHEAERLQSVRRPPCRRTWKSDTTW